MLKIFNTLSGKEEYFTPQSHDDVKMYVCGPTVYDRPHLGNARSIVFYDVLFRILKAIYPKVTYVRNITDVDDKILKRALEENISPLLLTKKVIEEFHSDTKMLNCLSPTFEPKATDFIPQMIVMIEKLIQNQNITSVTIVEKYQEVVDLVWNHCPKDNRFNLVLADVETWQPTGTWDCAWFDTWIGGNPLSQQQYKELILQKYSPFCNWIGVWEG